MIGQCQDSTNKNRKLAVSAGHRPDGEGTKKDTQRSRGSQLTKKPAYAGFLVSVLCSFLATRLAIQPYMFAEKEEEFKRIYSDYEGGVYVIDLKCHWSHHVSDRAELDGRHY